MTAIAMDGNNKVLPVALAFMESENTKSWFWFMRIVKTAIIGNHPNVCIIHYQHAGMLKAIMQLKQGEDDPHPWADLQSR